MALFRSIATIGGWTLVNRILGFVRTVLMANVLGVGIVTDAFFIAFKVAEFFRRFFAEGTFNAAFVPLYIENLKTGGRIAARRFSGEVAVVFGGVFLAVTVGAIVSMPALMTVVAAGFADEPERFAITVELTRIAFPYFLFMVLVAMLGGMLNAVDRFVATAAAPLSLNVVLISVLVALGAGVMWSPGHALAWGLTAAGLGHFLAVACACKRADILFSLPRPRLTPGVRRLATLMTPALIGSGVVQINLVVDVILASSLKEGSISYLYYADRVYQLPLAVIGIAVGTALLPLLTRQLQTGELDAAQDSQNRAIEVGLALTLPATAALLVIAGPITVVLFQRGAFDSAAMEATAAALAAYAAGLPAYVLIRTLTPGYFARQDTRTPLNVAAATMVVNVALAVALMQALAHVGIALATALAAWFNALALGAMLVRRGHLSIDDRLRRRLPRLLLATAALAAVLWWAEGRLSGLLAGDEASRIAAVAILVGGGALVFAALAVATGALRPTDLKRRLGRGAAPPGDSIDL